MAVTAAPVALAARQDFMDLAEAEVLTAVAVNRTMAGMALRVEMAGMAVAADTAAAVRAGLRLESCAREVQACNSRRSISHSGPEDLGEVPPAMRDRPGRFQIFIRERLFHLHRAPLGTHERFIGFLIEHYAGNFPLWLAPDQVRVITLNDDEALIAYAKPIVAELR